MINKKLFLISCNFSNYVLKKLFVLIWNNELCDLLVSITRFRYVTL